MQGINKILLIREIVSLGLMERVEIPLMFI